MGCVTRLELATSGVTGRCSNQIEPPPHNVGYLDLGLYKIAIGMITQYPTTSTKGASVTD